MPCLLGGEIILPKFPVPCGKYVRPSLFTKRTMSSRIDERLDRRAELVEASTPHKVLHVRAETLYPSKLVRQSKKFGKYFA
ncbi:MAG: hypothetical protein JWO50_697 [Candidatus Kaiserbacteria bacterium]|nr:hypothetical protein [Candidatus Kaiserbacteria bacterium]